MLAGPIAHLAQVSRQAARDEHELGKTFTFKPGADTYLAFRTAARSMVAAAQGDGRPEPAALPERQPAPRLVAQRELGAGHASTRDHAPGRDHRSTGRRYVRPAAGAGADSPG